MHAGEVTMSAYGPISPRLERAFFFVVGIAVGFYLHAALLAE
jgi:hypothetical protein